MYSNKDSNNNVIEMSIITKTSRIGIVGGGVSGLALGILLKERGYSNLRVFEKDAML